MRSYWQSLRARVASRERGSVCTIVCAAWFAVVGEGCWCEQTRACVLVESMPLLSRDRVPISGPLGVRREAQDTSERHPLERSLFL